jgi:NADH-quinone oxidoreductase subunit C
MSERIEALAAAVTAAFGDDTLRRRVTTPDALSYDVAPEKLLATLTQLRDRPELRFEVLMDVSGIDYLDYGRDEWRTTAASSTGFSRGVIRAGHGGHHEGQRFAAVYQLLSITHNRRLTLRCFCASDEEPVLPSCTGVHPGANWFEREIFDLFGIVFTDHPDLRRLLTDYGFIGHPFRKDFPLSGHVEVRYDETRKRVVYEPVQITPRTLVPRVIRDDNRYAPELKDARPAHQPAAIAGSTPAPASAPRGDGTIPNTRP